MPSEALSQLSRKNKKDQKRRRTHRIKKQLKKILFQKKSEEQEIDKENFIPEEVPQTTHNTRNARHFIEYITSKGERETERAE